jgi:ferredoxin
VRLSVYLVLAAALFPSSRFLLTIVLLVTLGTMWIKDYRFGKSPKIWYLAAAIGILLIGYGFARFDVKSVDELRLAKSPWGSGIELVKDGTYTGSGEGFRGPIEVQVDVRNHLITDVRTLEYPDLISVEDSELKSYRDELLKKGKLEPPGEPAMYRGANLTLTGYANAVGSALAKGIPDYPQYNPMATVFLNTFLGKAPNRVTLNALAILFAAFIVFEYALQSMLTPGTGRSINCYNCATCVGACPVKEVEGVQMPMGLVLLTRLGDYERVVELSKYCVGCGRCAAKCPIGNSGPLVISAAFQACMAQRREKKLETQGETA